MKAARQVSHKFLEMVETSKRFKDAQVLRVGKGKCSMGDLNVLLMNSDHIWRGIRIDVPHIWTDNSLTQINRQDLKNAEFVSLRMDPSLRSSKELDMEGLWRIVSFIRDLLSYTRNIKHLQIQAELFIINLRSVFECSDVQENLKTLERLDIIDNYNCTGKNTDTFAYSSWYLSTRPKHHIDKCLTDNFILLRTIVHRLQSFGMANGSFANKSCYEVKNALMSAGLGFLEANRESLKELSIHAEAWYDKNGVHGVTLPRLKSLTAATGVYLTSAQDSLKDFLANHPTLEELDVDTEVVLYKSLFDVIKSRSANLRKLHLKTKWFVDPATKEGEEKVDWTFIGEMKRLKDFALARPFCKNAGWKKYGTGTLILQCLPQNQLERLSLDGIGARDCGFWRLPDVLGRYIDIELTSKLALLGGFRNLRNLILRRCPDAVDDGIMEFILKEMTSLHELELSHCSRLSDVGIAGTSEDGSDSIRNLRIFESILLLSLFLISQFKLVYCSP